MAIRGIRGATTVEEDTPPAIVDATAELLDLLTDRNEVAPDDIAAAWFTTTRDLTAEFPAAAARRLGWSSVPLMCAHEMEVPAANPRSIARCIRVLLLVNSDRSAHDIHFVYLRGTDRLRESA